MSISDACCNKATTARSRGSFNCRRNRPHVTRITAAEGLRAAVLANDGLAIVSEWMFAPEIADGTVKVVLKDWQLPRMDSLGGFAGRADSACQSPNLCGVRPGGRVCSWRSQFGDIVIWRRCATSESGTERRFQMSALISALGARADMPLKAPIGRN
jgi:LysR substrate binding domain